MSVFNALSRRLRAAVAASVAAAAAFAPTIFAAAPAQAADKPAELRIDYAYYNPVSLVLKDKGWLEEELKADGISVRWVLSAGSNKALEFLNAQSLDFGSTAGAAALLARINGNPVKSIYVYSKPEWTALVTTKDSPIQTVADLKGKRVAATRGTDPHIFLIRTLAAAGLTEKDVRIVLLQHQDGRLALEKGDVDAWAGLDPLMAGAEFGFGARLFHRNADINTLGVLNVREEFAAKYPELVERVIKTYEKGRAFALANPDELRATIAAAAKLTDEVAARQLTRTDLSSGAFGDARRATVQGAGEALQAAGVIAADVKVDEAAKALIDESFVNKLGVK